MKVLLVNKFFYNKGGAESSLFQTASILERKGHRVMFFSMEHPKNIKSQYDKYFVSNVDYENYNLGNILKSSMRMLYSFEARKNIDRLIEEERPDIAHLNSIYHQISPSILHSLKKYNIPIVMTLHDCKMVCASYLMWYKGKICEACKGSKYYHCFLKGCVKNSRMKSLLNTVEMYLHHKLMHIYDLVDIFISPSLFLGSKLREMGFDKEIRTLANFVSLEEFKPQYDWREKSIVYFGRLSSEKGLFTLIEAVKNIEGVTLKLIGEGPIKEALESKIKNWDLKFRKNIIFLGYRTGEGLFNEIRNSMFVVLPSECNENNPRSIIEGFALGKPAIGARIGGIPELIKENNTGVMFEPANIEDLTNKISSLINNPNMIIEMGKKAREFVEKELNAEKHYQDFMAIYEFAKSKNFKNNEKFN